MTWRDLVVGLVAVSLWIVVKAIATVLAQRLTDWLDARVPPSDDPPKQSE